MNLIGLALLIGIIVLGFRIVFGFSSLSAIFRVVLCISIASVVLRIMVALLADAFHFAIQLAGVLIVVSLLGILLAILLGAALGRSTDPH